MKSAAILAAVLALPGCAAVQTAENQVVQSARAANDNAIQVWATAGCGLPLSAIIRHPEVVPALRALCLPAGQQGDASVLLK